jgi:hypothetical protein
MPRRSRRRADKRAEARRRARASEEELLEADEPDPPAQGVQRQQGGVLRRIFPPAPPLPGKPDPLAGFRYDGRGRAVVQHLWLLGRNPLAWIAMGGAWAFAQYMTITAGGGLESALFSMLAFAILITAGWIGWQRPWLYGAAAAALGTVLFVGVALATQLEAESALRVDQAAVGIVSNALLYAFIGAFAGWYGGYLRRRLAAPRPDQRRR